MKLTVYVNHQGSEVTLTFPSAQAIVTSSGSLTVLYKAPDSEEGFIQGFAPGEWNGIEPAEAE
jgi:hypothetical protein